MKFVLPLLLSLLFPSAPLARGDEPRWPIQITKGRITFLAESGLDRQVMGLFSLAQDRLASVEADLAEAPHIESVEVRLVKHQADIASAAPGGRGAPEWAVGMAYPTEGVVVIALRGKHGEFLDLEHALVHELAHLVLARAFSPRLPPRWLAEGFSYLYSSDISLERAQAIWGALLGDRLIRIRELDETFPDRHDEVALAYAQSYDFVTFLARRGRWQDERDDGDRAAFQQFLATTSRGTQVNEAALEAFGRTLDQLEEEWLESLRTRYLWLPLGAGGILLWGGASVLLIVGWVRRRRQAQKTLRNWEADEAKGASQEDAPPTTSLPRD
ncbi:MAG: hypothetical protein HY698_20935 [Deltaproteobacteria bacterium]|nr:hypothetical protein [Deltaproteobacteria bacterium]